MRLVLHPAADSEFTEAVRYYAEVSDKLGERFARHIEGLIREIDANPNRFRIFDPPAKRHFRRQFPYAVLYVDLAERIWIVAIMHFKQRPGYWRERLG